MNSNNVMGLVQTESTAAVFLGSSTHDNSEPMNGLPAIDPAYY